MNVSGTRVFDAPAQDVWDVLNDPEELATLLPGVQSFEVEDETHWNARVKVPLGRVSCPTPSTPCRNHQGPIEHARLAAKGTGVGAIVSMDTQFNLTPDGEKTSMDWEADVNVLGQGGSMGQRVLQPIVNQQVDNVLSALDQRVAEKSA